MKYACFSDIHGNIEAFKACYEDALKKNVNGFIFVGDYITDFLNSNEVINLIREIQSQYNCYIVKGNREDCILKYASGEENYLVGSNEESFLLTYYQLFQYNIDYIKNLQDSINFKINGLTVSLSHKLEDSSDADIVITGHTHIQSTMYDSDVLYINPGSVGLNNDGRVGATYSIITFNKKVSVEEYIVDYDIDKVITSVNNSLLSGINCCWDKILIDTLKTGLPYVSIFIYIMNNLAKNNGYDTNLDNIPKSLWQEALKLTEKKILENRNIEL